MKLALKALVLVLVLGSARNVAVAEHEELDNVGAAPAVAPSAVIVRANAQTRSVEAYRVQEVDRVALNQVLAQANTTDQAVRAANEAYINQVWARASASEANRVGSLTQIGSNEELNGVSSTPGWRRAWRNHWHWNDWCGYRPGYHWHRPYVQPGHFTYYNHSYYWAGHYGGYYNNHNHGHYAEPYAHGPYGNDGYNGNDGYYGNGGYNGNVGYYGNGGYNGNVGYYANGGYNGNVGYYANGGQPGNGYYPSYGIYYQR